MSDFELDPNTARAPAIFKVKGGRYPRQGDSAYNAQLDGQYRGYYPGNKVWAPKASTFGKARAGGHAGIDIYAPVGTPIYAPVPGTLYHTAPPGSDKAKNDLGVFSVLTFKSGGKNWQLLFGHLSNQAGKTGRKITAAQVKAGAVIGYVGVTGNGSGAKNKNGISAAHLHLVLEQSLSTKELRSASRIDPADALEWSLDPMTKEPGKAEAQPVSKVKEIRVFSDPAAQAAQALYIPPQVGTPQVQVPIRLDAHADFYKDLAKKLNDPAFAKETAAAWATNMSKRQGEFSAALTAAKQGLNGENWWGLLIHGNNFLKAILAVGVVAALPLAAFGVVTAATAATAMTAFSLGGLVYTFTADTVVNAVVLSRAQRQGQRTDPIFAVMGVPTSKDQVGIELGAGMTGVWTRTVMEEVTANAGKKVASRIMGVTASVVDLYAAGKSTLDRRQDIEELEDKIGRLQDTVAAFSDAISDLKQDEAKIIQLLKAQAKGNRDFWQEQDSMRQGWSLPGAPLPRTQYVIFEEQPLA